MGNGIRLKFEYVKQFVEIESESGCKLLSTKYVNDHEPLLFLDKKGHEFTTSWNKFKSRNKRQCSKCGYQNIANVQRLDGNIVYSNFIDKDYIPLFSPSDYTHDRQLLNYICSKHKNIGVQQITYDAIRSGHGCKFCGVKMQMDSYFKNKVDKSSLMKNSKFETIEPRLLYANIIYNDVLNSEYIPMFNLNDYKDCHSQLAIVCSKHLEQGIVYSRIDHIRTHQACRLCGIEKISGANCYMWTGGFTDIQNYLRNEISCWKFDSLKLCNFRCILTDNNSNIVIHHLKSFAELFYESMSNLKIENKQMVNQFTEKELRSIINECLRLHYMYGLGIVINSYLHNLFHHEYGIKNFTPSNFLGFVQRLKSHEFDDYLNDNNLKLNINYEIFNKLLSQYNLSLNEISKI